MAKKRLVVIGRGTAGAQTVAHFHRWMKDFEVEWHFDPNISPQAVGEGSALTLPVNLSNNLNFSHLDLSEIDGTFKSGIVKQGWGKTGEEFFHAFPPPELSYHFNAVKLQEYTYKKLKDKIKIVEQNTTADKVDADFVADCSGKPSDYSAFIESEYIPLNAVHVNQCFWDYPRFTHTLAIARPYGWVFGIPLTNRCSIGYLYNNKINSLEEVKEDMEYMFKTYNLTPSTTTNTFSFNSYYRKENFTERVAYNGNASFFLEPMEATSITVMDAIQRWAFDMWVSDRPVDEVNKCYETYMKQVETFIVMHYLAGSPFKTKFWEMAQEKAEKCFENIKNDAYFVDMYKKTRNIDNISQSFNVPNIYAQWWSGSFVQNIRGLGLYDKLDSLIGA
jgi:hypothetical protein